MAQIKKLPKSKNVVRNVFTDTVIFFLSRNMIFKTFLNSNKSANTLWKYRKIAYEEENLLYMRIQGIHYQ